MRPLGQHENRGLEKQYIPYKKKFQIGHFLANINPVVHPITETLGLVSVIPLGAYQTVIDDSGVTKAFTTATTLIWMV